MKLIKTIIVTLVLCYSANYSLQAKDFVENSKLNGDVESVITKEFAFGEDINDLILVSESREYYDSEGRLIAEKYLDGNGVILTSSKFQYSPYTKHIELFTFSNTGALVEKTVGEYCINTMDPINISFYDGDSQLEYQVKSVYKENRLDSLFCMDETNNLLISRKFNYLDNGSIDFIETNDYRMIKSSLSDVIESFDYDKNGKLILSKQLTSDGRLISFWEYTYNPMGELETSTYYPTLESTNFTKMKISYKQGTELMGITYYNKDNTISEREIFVRDSQNNVYGYSVYQLDDRRLTPSFTQSFNSNGLEVRRILYDTFQRVGEAIRVEYTFDHFNNWIVKEEKSMRGIRRIFKREISYRERN